ncbi:hypothetical protein BRADI_5g22611v3, partial [Brachypodium distachyon]
KQKTNSKPSNPPAISSALAPGANTPPAAVSSSSPKPGITRTDVAPSLEEPQQAAKVSPPPPPFASGKWGFAAGGASSSDEEEEQDKKKGSKRAPAVKKGGKPKPKGKDKYLLPRAAPPSDEAEDLFMSGTPNPGARSAFDDDDHAHLPLSSFDPFADAEAATGGAAGDGDYVHLRVQQRNGRKTLTTVQGLSAGYNYARVLRDLKKELCCNGTVVEDKELGNVIQLQGDHRKRVAAFLAKAGIAKKDDIKVHGF